MKTIYRIAKTELLTLFYSPVAWLVLMIFALQLGINFVDQFGECVKSQTLGYRVYNATGRIFTGWGLFRMIKSELYLYLPLLTMGLISREIGSGSIKLLFSSPISIVKIVLGKYLAMAAYCLLFIVILFVPVIFSWFTVESLDVPSILVAMLGLYLLICSYAAIGLFMSCLTSYQVVAAMGTFAVLAALNYIGKVGQGVEFIRDITYWLSLADRTEDLLYGLINSTDIIYFLVIIALFVTVSVLKLRSKVEKTSLKGSTLRYTGVTVAAIALIYIFSLPTMKYYYDATFTKRNTLTPNSQEIVEKIDGGLSITTYCNLFDGDFYTAAPKSVNYDKERFEKYVRFKPEIKMKYVYYYDKVNDPSFYKYYPNMTDDEIAKRICKVRKYNYNMFLKPEEIKKIIDLSAEENKFVRVIERENGQKAMLRLYDDTQRHPSETEISAALKRFVVKAPKAGFLQGHGERTIDRNRDKDYSAFVNNRRFRSSLINQGFDGVSVNLENEVPADIDVIVISDLREELSEAEYKHLDNYIARGGNMIILSDTERANIANPLLARFGVNLFDGIVVQPQRDLKPDVIGANITKEATEVGKKFWRLYAYRYQIAMTGAAALNYTGGNDFEMTPILTTNPQGSWVEKQTTDFSDYNVSCDANKGEKEEMSILALALNRKVNDKEQRIFILGDSDCISNGELSRQRNKINAANFSLIPAMFEWLSYGEYPIDTTRPTPPDNKVYFTKPSMKYLKVVFFGLLPALFGLLGIVIWVRRKKQ